MSPNHTTAVQVRDTWYGWRAAEAYVDDLEDIHWFQPPGAPHSIVHAYAQCTKLRGDIPHGCTATRGPHRLLVCLLKRCVAPSVHAELVRRAHNRQATPVEPAAGGRVLAQPQRDGASRSVPWFLFAAGGGLVLAVVLAQRLGLRVALPAAVVSRSAAKRRADRSRHDRDRRSVRSEVPKSKQEIAGPEGPGSASPARLVTVHRPYKQTCTRLEDGWTRAVRE
jgi:hypothetical protein